MKFIEETHKYIGVNNNPFQSVTSILKLLEPLKNWNEIAKKYAKKNGLTIEEVKKAWKYEKDISIIRGKKFHASEEAKDLSSEYAVIMSDTGEKVTLPVHKSVTAGGIKYESKQVLLDGVYPEIILWLEEYGIAGQADKVVIYNKLIDIFDYKTNKKIEKSGWLDFKTGKTKKLVPPCDHLDDCNFSIYSLQLNFYAYIIKENNPGYRIGKMVIKHILFNENGNVTGIKDYIVPNLQKEVKDILKKLKK